LSETVGVLSMACIAMSFPVPIPVRDGGRHAQRILLDASRVCDACHISG
jgi:hypothetical protein